MSSAGPKHLGSEQMRALERCLAEGGVAVFPTDTVYGLGCDPECRTAVERLYLLKGRPPDRPAAVLFFELEAALEFAREAGPRTAAAVGDLLPGALTVLVDNPRGRFALACGPEPGVLGLRVPELDASLAALADMRRPVLQSSANLSGHPEARTLAQLPASIRAQADLLLDAGRLGDTASTVLDLRDYERAGQWRVLRPGAVSTRELCRRLDAWGGPRP